MKKYIVMLVIWACICFLASTGHTKKDVTGKNTAVSTHSMAEVGKPLTATEQF